MDKILIFGHKNPDTDSVTSAISLSYLKNELGYNTRPRVLGDISAETKYVLDTFHVKKPKYLDNVYLQMKDISYERGFSINKNESLYKTYKLLEETGRSGIPVVKEDDKFLGLVTLKNLIKNVIKTDTDYINTSYNNILDVLNGESIVKADHEISGRLLVASYRSTTFLNYVNLEKDNILIVGNRHSIIEAAIEARVKLIIVIGNFKIKDEHIELAKQNKVNIINSRLDSINTVKVISLSNYLKEITESKKDTIYFYENDYYRDFLTISRRYKHNNYPILDKNDKCLGLIRVADIVNKNKKKVILVDHNDKEQSVEGLEEAEILEIVDHHNIGALSTNTPINIRSMTVGSTNTIIFGMYKDYNVDIPSNIAGLMLSGILSDTLILTSPTTTEIDRLAAFELAEIANVEVEEYGMNMLRAGTKIGDKSISDVLTSDFKIYTTFDDTKIGVSQIITFDVSEVMSKLDEYKSSMNDILSFERLDHMLVAITDVLEGGSYFIYTNDLEDVIRRAYRINDIKQGVFVDTIISRKQQIVPPILDNL